MEEICNSSHILNVCYRMQDKKLTFVPALQVISGKTLLLSNVFKIQMQKQGLFSQISRITPNGTPFSTTGTLEFVAAASQISKHIPSIRVCFIPKGKRRGERFLCIGQPYKPQSRNNASSIGFLLNQDVSFSSNLRVVLWNGTRRKQQLF